MLLFLFSKLWMVVFSFLLLLLNFQVFYSVVDHVLYDGLCILYSFRVFCILNFLKFIGYPSNYDLDEYLNILIDKLNSDNFPHEIGIFLGYPLKDVVGFMGYGKYKFCKTRYWKVYGDESVSDAVYNKFISDRAKIKVLLENNSLSELRKVI